MPLEPDPVGRFNRPKVVSSCDFFVVVVLLLLSWCVVGSLFFSSPSVFSSPNRLDCDQIRMLNLKVKKGRRERDIYRERWTTKSEGDGVHTPLMRVVSLLNFSDFLSRFYAFDSFIQPKIGRSFGHEISSSLTFTWNAFLSFLAGREDSFVWNSLRSASILYTRFYMQLTLSIHKTRPNCVCV